MSWIKDMEKLNLDKQNLKKFGITMGIAFLLITLLVFFKHRHITLSASSISVLFFISALIAPNLLRPVYILWMKLAFVLSWINTRLILALLFYLILTPMGLLIKLFRMDLLDKKIDKKRDSYWRRKEEAVFSQKNYERRF